MKEFKGFGRRRGSALLVVLGFLSFLMISGVAFAILMRVERQATSNYKHAVAARHLLEAGLFRAMDEVDAQLRISTNYYKFPDWEGRVLTSKMNTERMLVADYQQANIRASARTLSLESLSFIPPILVNDVRYYSIMTHTNTTQNLGKGTKWRMLSMPIENKVGLISPNVGNGKNAAGQAVVGRYAYTCINLSDMVNINGVAALGRSSSNRVSIAHLLMNPQAFETQRKDDGGYYATVQDFYAALSEQAGAAPIFKKGKNSPYFEFIAGRQGAGFRNMAFYDDGNISNHVFVTEGYARAYAETNSTAICNIGIPKNQPFGEKQADTLKLSQSQWATTSFSPGFQDAIQRVFTTMTDTENLRFAAMVADYLSPDDQPPKRLDVPSCTRAPMIAAVRIEDAMRPKLIKETESGPNPPATQKTIYKLQLMSGGISASSMTDIMAGLADPDRGVFNVKLCWPFRKEKLEEEYTLSIDGDIFLGTDPRTTSTDQWVAKNQLPGSFSFAGEGGKTLHGTGLSPNNQDDCFFVDKATATQFSPSNPDNWTITLLQLDGGGNPIGEGLVNPASPLVINVRFRVRLMKGNDVFDSVPQFGGPSYPRNWGVTQEAASERDIFTKIFFQTDRAFTLNQFIAANAGSDKAEQVLNLEWQALECPDPRFNHNPANWYVSNFSTGVSPEAALLMGRGGRDNGIFMTASGRGTMQSPGEMGFIARLFSARGSAAVDFLTHQLDNNAWINDPQYEPNELDDRRHFFRTIRLYDHGNDQAHKADPIFENFEYFEDEGTSSASQRVRINPLSDLPVVLAAAIDSVPFNYRLAWDNSDEAARVRNKDENYNFYMGATDWSTFASNWVDHVMDSVDEGQVNELQTKRRLAHVYGDRAYGTRHWYSDDPLEILGMRFNKPLYEVDRKMLYAFSQDAFSDRQQLFLYIMQAETTTSGVGGDTRSLAGGRAVALVWRDAYPRNYEAASSMTGQGQGPDGLYPWNWRKSPWDTGENNDTRRMNGSHEQKVLYFKQLDQ